MGGEGEGLGKFWFALPLEWSCLKTHSAAALVPRGITGQTHTAGLENIGAQEWVQEWVGPVQEWEQPPGTGHSYMIPFCSSETAQFPQFPSSAQLTSIGRQWQGTQNSPSHTAGEIAAIETSVVQKKIPNPLSGKLSEGWGELCSECSQRHSPAPAGTSVPWLFIWYKLASFF